MAISNLYERIMQMRRSEINFFDLLNPGYKSLDLVRLFMMLLFLAQGHNIDLYQDEEETSIIVKVKEMDDIEY